MAKYSDLRGEAVRAGDLLREVMGGGTSVLTNTQRAMRAWHDANGDIEHRHTVGVYLKEDVRQGLDPVLYVYVDSNVIMQEFNTKRPIYLARLASAGLAVSGLEFRLSRTRRDVRTASGTKAECPSRQLPKLSAEETAQIEEMAQAVPEQLRQSVLEAMILSHRKQQSNRTP